MFKTCAKELTKWRERLATKRENKKAATARACQADNMKPCAPWWQRPSVVLCSDLGPDEHFPCGSDVNTRSMMLASTKPKGDWEVT